MEKISTGHRALRLLHEEMDACRACNTVVGPVVHGGPVMSPVLLIGQAPGIHEGELGKPFAWTAGRTLFRWFEEALGIREEEFRARVYMAAVIRCFPGKARGGDRKPSPDEVRRCRRFLEAEVRALRPELVIPVGAMAIDEVLGKRAPLVDVIGQTFAVPFHGQAADVIPLPHPSGASPWHKMEPGRTLLRKGLQLIADHPAARSALRDIAPRTGGTRVE